MSKSLEDIQQEHGSSCDCYEEEVMHKTTVILGDNCKKQNHENLEKLEKELSTSMSETTNDR